MSRARLLLLAAASLSLAATAARAQGPSEPKPWVPLDATSLEAARGGFEVGGVTFDFGAVVNTYVGGALALTTTLNWTPQGAAVQQVQGAAQANAATPQQAAAILLGLGLNPSLATTGVVLKEGSGITVVSQQLDAQHLNNLIVNTASGQNIRQETSLNITLPGFASTQQTMSRQLSATALSNAISQAVRMASPR